MASKIILDGYNVIHKLPHLAGLLPAGLQGAREALVRRMTEWRQSRGGEVVIVFDRKKDALTGAPEPSARKTAGVSCVFTAPGIEADDKIISMLKNEKDLSGVTVVSADSKVINNCKAFGVKAVPPSFLDKTSTKRGKAASSGEAKQLPPGREQDITRWYLEQMNR